MLSALFSLIFIQKQPTSYSFLHYSKLRQTAFVLFNRQLKKQGNIICPW
jgi:hypothetical protein